MDGMQVTMPPNSGRPTEETRILVCQCGSTSFVDKKATKTAVVFRCQKCGADTSVKGRVAVVRAAREEVSFAVTSKITAPTPPPEKEDGTPTDDAQEQGTQEQGKKKSLGEQGFVQYRYRVAKEADEGTIRPAMEAVRILNCKDERFRAQTWQGEALEAICADFLAGCDPRVLQIIEAQEQVVAAEAARVEAKDGRALTARKKARLRAAVRDEMAERLGLVPSTALEPQEEDPALQASVQQYEEAQAAKQAEAEADDRVEDDGALIDALNEARKEVLRTNPEASIRLGGPQEEVGFRRVAAEKGWYLIQAIGDERTKTRAGTRPILYLVGDCFDGFDCEPFYLESLSAVVEAPEILFVEILPSDYSELPEDEQWDAPDFVEARAIEGSEKTHESA